MPLPPAVHTFPFDTQIVGQETTLYPSGVETDAGLLLVDVGLPSTVDTVLDQIVEAEFSTEDIHMVVLTHQDIDHAGGIARLLEVADPTVIAHERDSPIIDGRETPRVTPEGERYEPGRVDIEVGREATINTRAGPARVIETPGHTPGHISLYLPDAQLLIAGDAVIVTGERLYPPKSDFTMDPDTARHSIGTLSELDIQRVLCYHGGFIESGSDRLANLARAD